MRLLERPFAAMLRSTVRAPLIFHLFAEASVFAFHTEGGFSSERQEM